MKSDRENCQGREGEVSENRLELEREIASTLEDLDETRRKLVALRRRLPPEPVRDYELRDADGPVRLSEMFGNSDDLILVHNMGTGCSNCTMWADEFNGVCQHLQSRAAFVVVSPDSPSVQQEFARRRGWRFPMYSAEGTSFVKDMGFQWEEEEFMSGYQPGVSVFRKNNDGTIVRVAKDYFGPGDLYCGVWHLFDLLPDGPDGWDPLFDYNIISQ